MEEGFRKQVALASASCSLAKCLARLRLIAMTEDHSQVHSTYCKLTGRGMPLGISEHLRWNAWKARGWTDADLELVIRHIQSLMAAKRRYPESLRLYNLIDPDRFQEDLVEARALARIPKPDRGKESVLKATGREVTHEKPARTAAQVMAGDEALKALLRLRDTL